MFFRMKKLEKIDYSLDIARELIPNHARHLLARSLSLLPEEVVNFVADNLLFISSEGGEYITFNHPFFQNRKGFILLPSDLWKKKPIEIAFVIAHEIAHAYMNDEIKSWDDMEKRIPNEIKADKTAVRWLSKSYSEKNLRRLCDYWR